MEISSIELKPVGGEQFEEKCKKKKHIKTFKDYYNDNEFKDKHLKKMREKIECNKCGNFVSRSNMSKHKKSKLCIAISKIRELEKKNEVEASKNDKRKSI